MVERQPVTVPLDYPSSLIYIDESGSAGNSRCWVIGALKVRRHGELLRRVRDLRDKTGFNSEFRFTRISERNLEVHLALVDLLVSGDVNFAAAVVDTAIENPHQRKQERWRTQAGVTARLLRGCINRRELVSIAIDYISTPPDVGFEDHVANAVNRHFGAKSVISAACLDSRCCDGLQMVDVMAGAVRWENGGGTTPRSRPKEALVDHVRRSFNMRALRGRTPRVNIQVLGAERSARG